jgi:hypothetical protein
MDLDNVTASVVIGDQGALTFERMALQGSKSQNLTFWPSDIPLLLSAFRVTDSGVIVQRDVTVRGRRVDGAGGLAGSAGHRERTTAASPPPRAPQRTLSVCAAPLPALTLPGLRPPPPLPARPRCASPTPPRCSPRCRRCPAAS